MTAYYVIGILLGVDDTRMNETHISASRVHHSRMRKRAGNQINSNVVFGGNGCCEEAQSRGEGQGGPGARPPRPEGSEGAAQVVPSPKASWGGGTAGVRAKWEECHLQGPWRAESWERRM